jgi:hypothetical protein
LDTLGQDRGFTKDERRFILNTIAKFRDIWEAEQRDNLTRDRDDRLTYARPERDGEGEAEAAEDDDQDNADCIADIERQIEEHMLQIQDEIEEERKDFVMKELRL